MTKINSKKKVTKKEVTKEEVTKPKIIRPLRKYANYKVVGSQTGKVTFGCGAVIVDAKDLETFANFKESEEGKRILQEVQDIVQSLDYVSMVSLMKDIDKVQKVMKLFKHPGLKSLGNLTKAAANYYSYHQINFITPTTLRRLAATTK